MSEKIRPDSEIQSRDDRFFVYYFDALYDELKKVEDTESPKYYQRAGAICNYIVAFWRKKVDEMPQKPGSFGLDENGVEQPALCMDINSNAETTICKWGLEMDDNGSRVAKLHILTTPHPYGFHSHRSPHTNIIDLTQNTLTIERTNWPPKHPKCTIEKVSITFSSSTEQSTLENDALISHPDQNNPGVRKIPSASSIPSER